MPRIITASLFTSLTSTNSFGTWQGYPLFTYSTVNSQFTGFVDRGVVTLLDLKSTMTGRVNAKRTLSTPLTLKSTFTPTVVKLGYLNTPVPILAVPPQPDPPADLPHNFTDEGKLTPTLFQIFYNGIPLLIMNAPEFGDTESLQPIHVKEYTRGNTLISFRVPSWGNEKIFEYSFEYMRAIERLALMNVMRLYLGRRLTIVDHLGVIRTGFILTPENETFEPKPNGFSAQFRFQQVD